MCVPVDTARRTVRSGRSPYTSRPTDAASHRAVSRSMTAIVGSRATRAPLRAPTDVPSTRSGVISRSNRARSIPTSTAPSTPPPPSTNAVVTAGSYARARASSGCSARIRTTTRCSTQKISSGISPAARLSTVNGMLQPACRESRKVTTT